MIVVVGCTRGGKDCVSKHIVEKTGYSFVVTYAERPMRDYEENGREHWFVSKAKMDKLYGSKEAILKTHIVDPVLKGKDTNYNGYRYCTLAEDLQKQEQVIILDMKGLADLRDAGIKATVLYIDCPKEIRRARAVINGDDLKAFEKRCRDEEKQFSNIKDKDIDFIIKNTGTLEELYDKVDEILDFII